MNSWVDCNCCNWRTHRYLILKYLKNGNLLKHLFKLKQFSEEATSFYAACILTVIRQMLSVNILHKSGLTRDLISTFYFIVINSYSDLHLGNLLLDDGGYPTLVDFERATKISSTTHNIRDIEIKLAYKLGQLIGEMLNGIV
ncbi:hypothetical protein HELRODRAFT_175617 [Helobdella robusta]|uniref:Protein kinase domain-containing protein n=1 Tax=Helobdella robusta TaxID=6412 RepID=T1F9F7_HELRO|nr:hypothetical protein HELRODRAFT_175617 [Helobdella robusta]ESO00639.1 hypothetical protein HELRODRAFT_175617 [Helobdella robusta]